MSSSKPSSDKVKVTVRRSNPAPVDAAGSDPVDEPQANLSAPDQSESAKSKVKVTVTSESTGAPEPDGEATSSADQTADAPVDQTDDSSAAAEPAAEPETASDAVDSSMLKRDMVAPRVRQPIRPARASNRKFWIWMSITLVLAAALLASVWPAITMLARNQSKRLAAAGERATGSEASLDFRLADALDHRNQIAAQHYASDLLAAGDPTRALKVINRATGAGESADFHATRIQALLETGHTHDTSADVSALLQQSPSEDQIITVIMAQTLAGQGSAAAALNARLSSPAALRRATLAEAGNVALASQLASSGLVRSSSALLEGLPSSPPRDLLLARLKAATGLKADRAEAASLYSSYLAAMPADINAHQAYAEVLDGLKQSDLAHKQRELAASLQAGRP